MLSLMYLDQQLAELQFLKTHGGEYNETWKWILFLFLILTSVFTIGKAKLSLPP